MSGSISQETKEWFKYALYECCMWNEEPSDYLIDLLLQDEVIANKLHSFEMKMYKDTTSAKKSLQDISQILKTDCRFSKMKKSLSVYYMLVLISEKTKEWFKCALKECYQDASDDFIEQSLQDEDIVDFLFLFESRKNDKDKHWARDALQGISNILNGRFADIKMEKSLSVYYLLMLISEEKKECFKCTLPLADS